MDVVIFYWVRVLIKVAKEDALLLFGRVNACIGTGAVSLADTIDGDESDGAAGFTAYDVVVPATEVVGVVGLV